jgi:hypothetical protein
MAGILGRKVGEWQIHMVPASPLPPPPLHMRLITSIAGYNRAESLADYKTGKEFIFMLVDLVSRGGNLLLNIGPSGL